VPYKGKWFIIIPGKKYFPITNTLGYFIGGTGDTEKSILKYWLQVAAVAVEEGSGTAGVDVIIRNGRYRQGPIP
jgi:hypothetical protein